MTTREHVMSLIMPNLPEDFSKTPALVVQYGLNYDSFYKHFGLLPVSEMPLSQLIHLKILYAMADFLYQQRVIERYCQRLPHNLGGNELVCPEPNHEWVNDITREYAMILMYPKITDHFKPLK